MKKICIFFILFGYLIGKSNTLKDTVFIHFIFESKRTKYYYFHTKSDYSKLHPYAIDAKRGISEFNFKIIVDSNDIINKAIPLKLYKYKGLFRGYEEILNIILLPDTNFKQNHLILYFPRNACMQYVWSNDVALVKRLYFKKRVD